MKTIFSIAFVIFCQMGFAATNEAKSRMQPISADCALTLGLKSSIHTVINSVWFESDNLGKAVGKFETATSNVASIVAQWVGSIRYYQSPEAKENPELLINRYQSDLNRVAVFGIIMSLDNWSSIPAEVGYLEDWNESRESLKSLLQTSERQTDLLIGEICN